MVKSNTSALGIIFPNSYDALVPELVSMRLMASIPFASRYRIIDFILSGMTNSGIGNISVIVNKNYHSLMDHLGSGREWDLVRKNGGLHIFPPFAEKEAKPYVGRASALANILDFLRDAKEKYIIMSDTNMVVNFDFHAMLQTHIENEADMTLAYCEQPIPSGFINAKNDGRSFYYTFDMEEDQIKKIYINSKEDGIKNFSMNIFIINRELLVEMVDNALVRGQEFFMRDVLIPQINKLNVKGYKYTGYVGFISDMKSYFDENMKLLDDYNLDSLFSGSPVYTKIRGDHPTQYVNGSRAQNVMVASGCIIEGDVENSVIFRGVKVAKGATVKNCILMQDTVISRAAVLHHVISDKNVEVMESRTLMGHDNYPMVIAKDSKV